MDRRGFLKCMVALAGSAALPAEAIESIARSITTSFSLPIEKLFTIVQLQDYNTPHSLVWIAPPGGEIVFPIGSRARLEFTPKWWGLFRDESELAIVKFGTLPRAADAVLHVVGSVYEGADFKSDHKNYYWDGERLHLYDPLPPRVFADAEIAKMDAETDYWESE